jgi:hypothetical protein
MPAWEDPADFLQTDEFATSATILSQRSGMTRPLVGILDEPGATPRLGDYEQDNTAPRFYCPASAAAGIERGDELTASTGAVYDVMRSPEPDGSGWVFIILAARGE